MNPTATPATGPIRVGLVDPIALLGNILADLLPLDYPDLALVYRADTAATAHATLQPGQIDVLIIADYLGDGAPDGFALAAAVRDRLPVPPILVASSSTGLAHPPAAAAAQAAAAGLLYLPAATSLAELVAALRQVAGGITIPTDPGKPGDVGARVRALTAQRGPIPLAPLADFDMPPKYISRLEGDRPPSASGAGPDVDG